MTISLESLPPELLALVLQSTTSPRYLFRLISASPVCFQLFNKTPHVFLSSTIKNSLPSETIRHLVEIVRIPDNIPNSDRTTQLRSGLGQYFDDSVSFELPESKSKLTKICRLITRLSNIVDGFFKKAMWGFTTFDQQVQRQNILSTPTLRVPAPAKLSINEQVRLQRAFLRFEIYCHAFPPDNEDIRPGSYPAQMQHDLFLVHLAPWEIEELCCVHQYYSSLIGDFIDEMEDDLVQAVLQAPGVMLPTSKQSREPGPTQPTSSYKHTSEDMLSFDSLDLTDLMLFDRSNRRAVPDNISFITSLGLCSIFQFIHDEKSDQIKFIQRNSPREREFLPQALLHTPQANFQPPQVRYDDDPSHANCGYSIFKPSPNQAILGIADQFSNCMIRELGYVFWDSWRIFPTPAFDTLNKAKTLDIDTSIRLFDRSRRESIEKRLHGVLLPQTQFRRIEKKFGSIYLAEEDDE